MKVNRKLINSDVSDASWTFRWKLKSILCIIQKNRTFFVRERNPSSDAPVYENNMKLVITDRADVQTPTQLGHQNSSD